MIKKQILLKLQACLVARFIYLFYLKHKCLVQALLSSWLIALGANISVPFYPIPMTLHTLAIASLALVLPWRTITSALLLYISYAIIELPVLEGGASGISKLLGPTAGYIIGFFAMAITISLLIKQFPTNQMFKRFLIISAGGFMCFILGISYLAYLFNWEVAIQTGLLPFIFSEPAKFLLAACIPNYTKSK